MHKTAANLVNIASILSAGLILMIVVIARIVNYWLGWAAFIYFVTYILLEPLFLIATIITNKKKYNVTEDGIATNKTIVVINLLFYLLVWAAVLYFIYGPPPQMLPF